MGFKSILSGIFGKAVSARNHKYDLKNPDQLVRCEYPVISVGNLSVGGTGKTPFTAMIARMLTSSGHKPAIIGRGYKKSSRGLVVVSDGKKILSDAESAGDEMMLFATTLDIPVIAHESKSDAAKEISGMFDIDCVIIDDGFQHRRLIRDLDIVLIDTETVENSALLPDGRLREPLESLSRADVICMTGNAELKPELKSSLNGKIFIRVASFPKAPHLLSNKNSPPQQFKKGHPIIPFSGIAKPDRFFNMLLTQGFDIIEPLTFDDHHKYVQKDIDRIIELCKVQKVSDIGTTEKDAVKLLTFEEKFKSSGISCHIFPIRLKVIEGENELASSLNKLFH